MPHLIRFSIKFVSTLVVLGIILGLFYNLGFTEVLTITVVLTLLGYIIGDLFILRRTSNIIASIADFGLSFLVVWFMSRNMNSYGWFFYSFCYFSCSCNLFWIYISSFFFKNKYSTVTQSAKHKREPRTIPNRSCRRFNSCKTWCKKPKKR